MRVEWATICKGIEDTEQGINLLGVQQDVGLVSGELPQVITPEVAVILATPRHEMDGETIHSIRCDVFAPDDQKVATRTEQFRLVRPGVDHYGVAEGRAVWPIVARFEATEEGAHRVEISVDEGTPMVLLYLVRLVPDLD